MRVAARMRRGPQDRTANPPTRARERAQTHERAHAHRTHTHTHTHTQTDTRTQARTAEKLTEFIARARHERRQDDPVKLVEERAVITVVYRSNDERRMLACP